MATIKGKWLFEGAVYTGGIESVKCRANFVSNGQQFYGMYGWGPTSYGGVDFIYFTTSALDLTAGNYIEVGDADDSYYLNPHEWLDEAYKTVDFGETEQEVTDTFLSWMQANATQQADPTPTNAVIVEYNNTIIASIVEGESVTLNCAGLKMKSGITVSVPEIIIDAIEEWDGSYVKEAYSPVTIINFTIAGVTYEAEEGMTWAEWVDSEYNTNGYHIPDDNTVVCKAGTRLTIYNDVGYLNEIDNTSYTHKDALVPAGIDWIQNEGSN